jgi:hypothetical protein
MEKEKRYVRPGEDGHWYPTPYGDLPGATTITGLKSKGDALCGWAAKVTKQGKDWKEEREGAGDYGTLAHHLTEVYDKGLQPIIESPDQENTLQKYIDWKAEYKPEILRIEDIVYWWNKEKQRGFGGTLDRVVRIEGIGTLVLDIKTGDIYEEGKMQAESYLRALNFFLAAQNLPPLPVDGIAILKLPKPDKPKTQFWYTTDSVEREFYWQMYLGLLDHWWAEQGLREYKKQRKATLKGGENE